MEGFKMALFEDYSDDNKVNIELPQTFKVSVGFHALQGIWYEIFNTVETERYVYIGMTLSAAEDCLLDVHDPDNGVNAVGRVVAGSMYEVEVSKYKTTESQEPLEEP